MTALVNRLGHPVAPRKVSVLPGMIGRMDPRAGKLRVIAGRGWLSVNGLDTILKPGCSFELPADCRDVPLVSALDNTTLVLEYSGR
jgi:hypothetical protein